MTRLPPPGTVLAERWRLVRLIAEGGMGAVYEARDEATGDAPVAIKLLHPELTLDPEVRRRFRRETAILRTLIHPAVVRVLDAAEDGRALFSVIELLTGHTLRERLDRHPTMNPEALLPLVEGVAAGLTAAHQHGVIHGDLTPANVFCVVPPTDSPVKLLDFGLSKVLGLERLTRTGEVTGTPAYLAPELLTGEGELDERIDTYALGVVIYECLAGRRPFEDRNPGRLMTRIVMGDAPALTAAAPHVDPALAAVVHRAMERRRAERYDSAAALAEAYRRALAS